MDSILETTKTLSGVMEEYETFNIDLIMYINNVFLTLKQLGVGPKEGFVIRDESATWSEFIPDNVSLREAVKSYMGNKVRLKFDPPTSSVLLEALNRDVAESEWRFNVEVETPMT